MVNGGERVSFLVAPGSFHVLVWLNSSMSLGLLL